MGLGPYQYWIFGADDDVIIREQENSDLRIIDQYYK